MFKTLLNEHYGDFRNSNAPTVPPEQGPREPWRDIHSKVEGPVAHDLFVNFFERWNKQGKKEGNLHPIDQTRIDVNAPAPLANNDPQKAWNVQFFRSITSDSAVFDPNRTRCLNGKKGRLAESSHPTAYIPQRRKP